MNSLRSYKDIVPTLRIYVDVADSVGTMPWIAIRSRPDGRI
ncbi:MAG TPA: hypothetical protein VGC19_08840 [Rhodanobacter sp.]